MSDSTRPVRAQLIELDASYQPKDGGKVVTVQFNPENLKVSFANQLVQPANGGVGDQRGSSGRQFVGAGTTKLALQIWFDVTSLPADSAQNTSDVRELTKNVAYFITPKKEGEHYIPPAVRFLWGSFQFDGLMDSLDESLEFFSDEGVPLRASMALNLSQQKIQEFSGRQGGQNLPPGGAGLGGAPAGTSPLAKASAGISLQAMVSGAGINASWQSVAAANGIENPRLLQPGQLINLNVSAGEGGQIRLGGG
jgi:hypothetical protein